MRKESRDSSFFSVKPKQKWSIFPAMRVSVKQTGKNQCKKRTEKEKIILRRCTPNDADGADAFDTDSQHDYSPTDLL